MVEHTGGARSRLLQKESVVLPVLYGAMSIGKSFAMALATLSALAAMLSKTSVAQSPLRLGTSLTKCAVFERVIANMFAVTGLSAFARLVPPELATSPIKPVVANDATPLGPLT